MRFISALTAIALLPNSAFACDQTLSPGDSIGGAVAAAADGAILCLNTGTYAEYVHVTASQFRPGSGHVGITLRGLGSSPADVVWAPFDILNEGRALRANGTIVHVDNITFQAGTTSALEVKGAGELFITSSVIQLGAATDGVGVVVAGTDNLLDITSTTFTGMKAAGNGTGNGAGIQADANSGGSTILVSGSTFSGGTAAKGGAISVESATVTLLVDTTTFSTNTATSDGGAVYFSGQDFSCDECVFTGDTGANLGGGISVVGGGDIVVSHSSFSGEQAYKGAGIYWAADNASDTLTVTTSEFLRGLATTAFTLNYAEGAGVYASTGALSVQDSLFNNNTAENTSASPNTNKAYGGAVSANSAADVTLQRNLICKSTATMLAGGVYVTGGTVTADHNIFVDNTTTSGAGGALYVRNVTGTFPNQTFIGNAAARSGGGSYLHQKTGSSTGSFTSSIFVDQVGTGAAASSVNTTLTHGYNLFSGTPGAPFVSVGGAASALGNDVTASPLFTSYSSDGDCTNDDLRLQTGSPAIGAGQGGVDIGAYGGTNPYRGAGRHHDADNDNYFAEVDDCDDANASAHPRLPERCSTAFDDDCDGLTNDSSAADLTTWYADSDGDGFGDTTIAVQACVAPTGYVSNNTDCDDTEPLVNPASVWYADADTDTYGAMTGGITQCVAPGGRVLDHTDCNDGDSSLNPATKWYADGDLDTYGDPLDHVDQCLDPGGSRVRNGEDCDDTKADLTPKTKWYADTDHDTYGDPDVIKLQCLAPQSYVRDDQDCNDANAQINPTTPWYKDADSDNYGALADVVRQCATPTDGRVRNSDDCNDADATLNPNTSWYADIDQDLYGDASSVLKQCLQPPNHVRDNRDCDDAAATLNPDTRWYADSDHDTFGNPSQSLSQCESPSGYVLDDRDCNDVDATLTPNTKWYADSDGDSYGNLNVSKTQCNQPSGYIRDSGDCNDNDPLVPTEVPWYVDADLDGHGDPLAPAPDCHAGAPFVKSSDDCDDAVRTTYTGAVDVCGDGVDNNCDGVGGGDNADDDEDGVTYAQEKLYNANDCNPDSDGDTVLDNWEVKQDTDRDALRDIVDTDDDGDGVPTAQERNPPLGGNKDTDGDGKWDYVDADDDGDGLCTKALATGNPLRSTCVGSEDLDGDGNPLNDDLDRDGLTNFLDDDDDDDAILTRIEAQWGADPLKADTDGDGIDDGREWMDANYDHGYDGGTDGGAGFDPLDYDYDGIFDFKDTDDDDDGISTSIEGDGDIDAAFPPSCPVVEQPPADICSLLAPDGIPNYHDLDSDGDGLFDFEEGLADADGDFVKDWRDCWNCGGVDVDDDGDGLTNSQEVLVTGADGSVMNTANVDSDGDGLCDGPAVSDACVGNESVGLSFDETGGFAVAVRTPGLDTDRDRVPDSLDPDDDGDAVSTSLEDLNNDGDPRNDDTDGDGTPNYLDPDDDDDGIFSLEEGTGDLDGDLRPDYLDANPMDGTLADADDDGLLNGEEQALGLDPYNADSDGDGLDDAYEESVGDGDLDGDGILNALDDDDDGDGIPTAIEGSLDPDGDTIPACFDDDSDGDDVLDKDELPGADSDCDGILDVFDGFDDAACGPFDTSAAAPLEPIITPDNGGCSSASSTGGSFAGALLVLLVLGRRRRS